jgi:hypothetical protein
MLNIFKKAMILPVLWLLLPAGISPAAGQSVSAFGVADIKTSSGGWGVSLTASGQGITDISYISTGSYRLIQTSGLSSALGILPISVGIAAGYVDPTEDTTFSRGFVSGLEVGMGIIKSSTGPSITIKATSLSTEFNPIKWVTDPDMLWIGAGLSFSF